MKKIWFINILIIFVLSLSACGSSLFLPGSEPNATQVPEVITTQIAVSSNPAQTLSAANPCVGAAAPAQWKHIVVLVFENKKYDQVIGKASYITSLSQRCATVTNWKDADTRVDGFEDADYHSKPGYATLTSGLSPSIHGLLDDNYETTTSVDNIFHQLYQAGNSFKDYYDADAGGCSVRFEGDYHDPIRYYTNIADICNEHDVPLANFMTDVNSGNLPTFSFLLPSNNHNMHNNSIADGDAYAKNLLEPLLNSQTYARGDVAIFFLWDEADSNKNDQSTIPNVLVAPSIKPGTIITGQSGNPISHFSALRTWEEMLGLPLLGDTPRAPSLLPFFNGR